MPRFSRQDGASTAPVVSWSNPLCRACQKLFDGIATLADESLYKPNTVTDSIGSSAALGCPRCTAVVRKIQSRRTYDVEFPEIGQSKVKYWLLSLYEDPDCQLLSKENKEGPIERVRIRYRRAIVHFFSQSLGIQISFEFGLVGPQDMSFHHHEDAPSASERTSCPPGLLQTSRCERQFCTWPASTLAAVQEWVEHCDE